MGDFLDDAAAMFALRTPSKHASEQVHVELAALRERAARAAALEAALALTVEALREIGDHRGLVAHHGDALDAGLRALAAAKAAIPGGAT